MSNSIIASVDVLYRCDIFQNAKKNAIKAESPFKMVINKRFSQRKEKTAKTAAGMKKKVKS